MIRSTRALPLFVLTLLACSTLARQAHAQKLPTIEEKTASLERQDGFFPLYWDDDAGTIWLEIPETGADFLYVVSLPTGLGSNDIGLDRNQLGSEQVVRFERVGRKLLLVAPNLDYRALSDNPDEVASVREAFADGTVFAFTIAARTGDRLLVDATSFVVRDAHGVIGRLAGSGQGTFRLDSGMSVPNPQVLKAFPDNTEMEARLTYTSDRPGGYVRSVASVPGSFSLRVRHSFVRLPDGNFKPRAFDPRSGYGAFSYADYAAPIGSDMVKRFIPRHRLEKVDPNAALSDAKEPIVYYLDRGTPEPVRSALLEGARWWNQAFFAAGFRNAFRVEILPEGADPLDVRYNMINWVHRSTRGWSYGSSVTDPRTGEIIKGHVLLGSLRVRQDYLIMEGLLSPYEKSNSASPDAMLEVSLARIRQLSAHEVGHTIGLSHNFASSANDRASVMDYPAPLVDLQTGVLTDTYDTGIGAWDKIAIRYGYSVFPDSVDESAALEAILKEGYDAGLRYITDSDARPIGAAHPYANLWDNGTNPATALREALTNRGLAFQRFGLASIKKGQPLATLQEVLVPLYLHHRYQVEAAAKMLGGSSYTYALRGDLRALPTAVSGPMQQDAVNALLESVSPQILGLPLALRHSIPPRPPGFGRSRELFSGYADPLFDPYAPAEVGATLVFSQILAPERMARMMYQTDLDASLPSLSDILAKVSDAVWTGQTPTDSYLAEINRVVQSVWTDALIEAASRSDLAPGVRARLWQHLEDLADYLTGSPGTSFEETAHRGYHLANLERYLTRLYDPAQRPSAVPAPPGSPIGSGDSALPGVDATLRQEVRRGWLSAWEADSAICDVGG